MLKIKNLLNFGQVKLNGDPVKPSKVKGTLWTIAAVVGSLAIPLLLASAAFTVVSGVLLIASGLGALAGAAQISSSILTMVTAFTTGVGVVQAIRNAHYHFSAKKAPASS